MKHEHHPSPETVEVLEVAGSWPVPELTVAIVLMVMAVLYVIPARHLRTGGSWPVWRTLLWLTGLVCLAAGLSGPLARAATTGFTDHMLVHLLIGMIAPVLLVLAAPITLALRVLPTSRARLVSTVLRSRPARVLSHPVTAGVLNAGGLWLLYTTPLYHLMHDHPVVHVAVHLHVILAGIVFTASIIGPDPNPHRAGFPLRVVVMVAFIAAHSILGKWLYAHPPEGVGQGDAQLGAQLMYYGGDVVDVAILILLFAGWYARDTRVPLLKPNATRVGT